MKVSFSAQALDDAQQQADWYITQGAWAAAQALHLALVHAVQRVAVSPGLGSPGPLGTRLWPLRRFPVSLVYRVDGESLRIIAVAPHRRRPGFWAGRR